MTDILESGITELIGINEQVAQNQFAASAAFAIPMDRLRQGVIRSLGFYLNGAAVGISPAGELLLLDADPAVSAGDTDLSEAEWLTIFGNVPLVNADIISDGTPAGGIATYPDLYIPFCRMSIMYLVFKLTSATQFNSLAGDDESLSVGFWWTERL